MAGSEYFRVRRFGEHIHWRPDLRPHFFERDTFYDAPGDRGDLRSLSIETAASFIQSWLFFGLLDVVAESDGFEGYIERTREDGEDVVVNEQQIIADVDKHFSAPDRDQRVAAALFYIDFARSKCEQLDETSFWNQFADETLGLPDSVGPVLLSVRLLLGHLRIEIQRFEKLLSRTRIWMRSSSSRFSGRKVDRRGQTYSQHNNLLGPALPPGARHQSILSDRELAEAFARSNWCPARARQVRCSFNILTVFGLSHAKRRKETARNHEKCDLICTAYDLSPQELLEYQQKHIPGCSCEPTQPNEPGGSEGITEEVFKIINDGEIPLVTVQYQHGRPQLKVVRYDGFATFTAISHVWLDGLGNARANSIHDCQLARLTDILHQLAQQDNERLPWLEKWMRGDMVKKLWLRQVKKVTVGHHFYFWLDTLCIPQYREGMDAESHRAVKNKAIRLITPTFQAASQVLVLDSDLETIPSITTDTDIDVQIERCLTGGKWIQRAWTLEEGGQARKCWVRLADGSLNKLRSNDASLLCGPLNDTRKTATNMGSGRKAAHWLERTRVTQFCDSWNNIQYRSISDRSDLLKIFASILDLDSRDLPRNISESSKLAMIIKSCSTVPLELLFTQEILPSNETISMDHSLDAWIPRSPETNAIANGISMRSVVVEHRHYGFEISLQDMFASESIEIMKISTTEFFASRFVRLQSAAYSDHDVVIEAYCGPNVHPETEALLIFDKSTGSRSLNAHFALGALLLPVEFDDAVQTDPGLWPRLSRNHRTIAYRHWTHLTVYLPEQWKLRYSQPSLSTMSLPTVIGRSLSQTKSTVLIRTETVPKRMLLSQRPLRDHPTSTPRVAIVCGSLVAGLSFPNGMKTWFECDKDSEPCKWGYCPDPYWNGCDSQGCNVVFWTSRIPQLPVMVFALFFLRLYYKRRHRSWLQAMGVGKMQQANSSPRTWRNRIFPRRGLENSNDPEDTLIRLD